MALIITTLPVLLLLLLISQHHTVLAGSFFDRNVVDGRETFVHLFEWRWDDIARECTEFLPKHGFGAVQVSPPMEHAVIIDGNKKYPWWQRYQPVSYKLVSRSGNLQQFTDMVNTCNKAGVRIYVDAVVNHMTGGQKGNGSAGTYYDGDKMDYPGVPYSYLDFNGAVDCRFDTNKNEDLRNCRLSGLRDLNQGKSYVRDKIAGYLNHLIDIGVAGFRMDAAKHMWPGDLKIIYGMLHDLNNTYFPTGSKPFIFQEIIDYGDKQLNEFENFAGVTEFKYSQFLAQAVKKSGKSLSLLQVFGQQWNGFAPSKSAVVFTDNHDSERDFACKFGLITSRDPRAYKIAHTFGLAWPYGFPKVLSGYRWQINCQGDKDLNRWIGPPHNEDYSTKRVVINKDNTCQGGWTCTHRWRQIYNMAHFRKVVGTSDVMNWWDNQSNQISFSRGTRGFVVINNDNYDLSRTVTTGLPAGTYCDIISGNLKDNACTGKKIYVDSNGKAKISIKKSDEDPMMATHLEAKIEGQVTSKPGKVTSKPVRPTGNYSRTVIFVYKKLQFGQNLFLRGGLDHKRVKGCTNDAETSECAIPIKHRLQTSSATYEAWKKGDLYLDWYGAEAQQGKYKGVAASGSPMLWTTNQLPNANYHPLNKYGPHYWVLDVDMDCTRTLNQWFEAKALVGSQWENDVHQVAECKGDGAKNPFTDSKNHVLQCGKVNVVKFNEKSCQILSF